MSATSGSDTVTVPLLQTNSADIAQVIDRLFMDQLYLRLEPQPVQPDLPDSRGIGRRQRVAAMARSVRSRTRRVYGTSEWAGGSATMHCSARS